MRACGSAPLVLHRLGQREFAACGPGACPQHQHQLVSAFAVADPAVLVAESELIAAAFQVAAWDVVTDTVPAALEQGDEAFTLGSRDPLRAGSRVGQAHPRHLERPAGKPAGRSPLTTRDYDPVIFCAGT